MTFPYQGSKMKGSSRKKKQTSGCSQLVISILILSYFSFPISDTVSFLLFLIFSLSFFVEVLIFYNYLLSFSSNLCHNNSWISIFIPLFSFMILSLHNYLLLHSNFMSFSFYGFLFGFHIFIFAII